MERDNKKARDDARREYNETVRVRNQASMFDSISYLVAVPCQIHPQT
jgi:hypothetical protein